MQQETQQDEKNRAAAHAAMQHIGGCIMLDTSPYAVIENYIRNKRSEPLALPIPPSCQTLALFSGTQ